MIDIDEIITGERIQKNCDIQIGYKDDFNFNANISNILTNPIYLDNLKEPVVIKNKKVFIYGFLTYKLPKLFEFKNCTIYFHNSDENINKEINIDDSNEIYCQNNATKKYHMLPLGIANSMWRHGNIHILYSVMKQNIRKNNNIFFQFSINTNREKRNHCFNICKKKDIKWIQHSRNQKKYLQKLASYKYAICPEGNGYDSHRIWECLYLGIIPILLENNFSTELKKFLEPENKIIVLDSWESLDTNKLLESYEKFNANYEKLKLSYYL